jgi:hypothetical protein
MYALNAKRAPESGKNAKPGNVIMRNELMTKLSMKIIQNSEKGSYWSKWGNGELCFPKNGGGRYQFNTTTVIKTPPKNNRFMKARSLPRFESTATYDDNLLITLSSHLFGLLILGVVVINFSLR